MSRRLRLILAGGALLLLLACGSLLLLAYTRVPAALSDHVARRATRLYVDASSWEEVAEVEVDGTLRPRLDLAEWKVDGVWCLDVTVYGRRRGLSRSDSLRWVGRQAANGEWVALPLGMISTVSLAQPHHPCAPAGPISRWDVGESQ